MLDKITKLVKEMRWCMPFTGDRKFVREIIATVMKDEYSANKSSRLAELESKVNKLSLKFGITNP